MRTETRLLPWSRDLGPCFAPISNDLDPAKVHDVTLEIHAEEPSRRGIWGPFDEGGLEAEIARPKYRGKWIRASHLMIRGELVEGKTLRVVRDVDFEHLPDGPPKWEFMPPSKGEMTIAEVSVCVRDHQAETAG